MNKEENEQAYEDIYKKIHKFDLKENQVYIVHCKDTCSLTNNSKSGRKITPVFTHHQQFIQYLLKFAVSTNYFITVAKSAITQ